MIIEIALGVVLGVILLVFWREIMALGIVVIVLGLLLLIVLLGGIFLYTAVQTAKASSELQAVNSTFGVLVGMAVNFIFAFACGHVFEQRTTLSRREAYVFGAIFYILVIATVTVTELILPRYLDTSHPQDLLYLLATVAIWGVTCWECLRRIKRNKHPTSLYKEA